MLSLNSCNSSDTYSEKSSTSEWQRSGFDVKPCILVRTCTCPEKKVEMSRFRTGKTLTSIWPTPFQRSYWRIWETKSREHLSLKMWTDLHGFILYLDCDNSSPFELVKNRCLLVIEQIPWLNRQQFSFDKLGWPVLHQLRWTGTVTPSSQKKKNQTQKAKHENCINPRIYVDNWFKRRSVTERSKW